MEWKDVGKFVAKAAPVLGGVLGGPAGAAAGAAGNLVASALGVEADPDQVQKAMESDPEAAIKLKELENQHRDRLLSWQEKQLEAETEQLKSVNKTMQAEAKSEKWPQYTWRPYNGFLFGTTMFGVYFVLPLMDKEIPEIDYWVWMAWAAVLGVTSWHRGKQKRAQAGENNAGGGAVSKAAGALKRALSGQG